MIRPTVSISGFSSDVGKTGLMCELLRAFPGWEAIKMTRGHYRSCGKDPQACCVSHLLKDEPVIRSGREETYAPGKDTGRYWDAGASNVHWVIVTDSQVERGISRALELVNAPGVFIEGTSFLQFVTVEYAIMVARSPFKQIKASARRALSRMDALYLFEDAAQQSSRDQRALWQETQARVGLENDIPIYTRADLPRLISNVSEISKALAI